MKYIKHFGVKYYLHTDSRGGCKWVSSSGYRMLLSTRSTVPDDGHYYSTTDPCEMARKMGWGVFEEEEEESHPEWNDHT